VDVDAQFFAQHPDRRARIRLPGREAYTNKQRAVQYLDECEIQFRSLGQHDKKRRRIVVYRLSDDHPTHPNHLMKIPFVLFADETVEDTDAVLLPLVHQFMVREVNKGVH
jgi:hypothetical protein